MIKIEQTYLLPPKGNCQAACLASVLELPLESIPDLSDEWYSTMQTFLNSLNLKAVIITISPNDLDAISKKEHMSGYGILGAKSTRGNWLHAVVLLDGEIVHDPHPLREMGVGEWVDFTSIALLDPSIKSGVEEYREKWKKNIIQESGVN